jgi:hypothetical protein
MGCHRKRRIHQRDGRTHRGVEMVVDVSRVVPGDRDPGKKMVE